MDSVQSFEYNNKQYLLLEGIKETGLNDKYFLGCKSMRKCVEKHGIPESVCLFVKNDKVYTKNYKAADVYVEKHYAKTNILDTRVFEKNKQVVVETRKKAVKEKRVARKQYDEHAITEAPPLIELDDHEMFKDAEGNPMEIEVRGEKQWDKAYFKAYDVGKAFGYKKIVANILDEASNFVYNRHYMFYRVFDVLIADVDTTDDDTKVLYLTYLGVVKLLSCARGDKAERFQEWAARCLFAIQMGNTDARDKVAAETLRVGQSTITELFRKSSSRVPCVYLFEIGKVGNLRSNLDLSGFTDDNATVYKYGMTSDMAKRSSAHAKTYGKWKGSDFKLAVFSYIDAVYVSEAETSLKNTFDHMSARVCSTDTDRTELIVATNAQMTFIKEAYKSIYAQYAGNNANLIRQLHEFQHREQLMKKDIEIMQMTNANKIQEYEIKMKDCELMYLRKMMNVKE